ncbi:hypothetical protein DPMN_142968 [Dreissena polymorpha]|uniref:G-protein coupled receptors family 1 profile domain-containing protein n=1 Tax=Dreissena polymorpha TaxID=45954 RepID=A0A9D4GCQ1_DREPO|nr:hypothetical protein DPMN_142968 [Dreissena polymorpha]
MMPHFYTSNVTEKSSSRENHGVPYMNITADEIDLHPVTRCIELYIIPILCIIGVIGNTLSTIIFMNKTLRNSSCSIFLAVRGMSDNGFLTTLLIPWISRTLRLELGSTNGVCQLIVFLTYVCGFISVWMVVFVTAENYIRICRPFIVSRMCTPAKAKLVVAALGLTAVALYNFPFWAMTPSSCESYPILYNVVQGLVYTDTVLTLVFPFVCIALLMTAIVCDLVRSYKRRNHHRAPNARNNRNPMAKVTKMLFAVTISFFVLNLPSHVSRLRSTLINMKTGGGLSSLDQAVGQITLLIYYSSLAFNIVLYITFGSRFRCVFIEVFCSRCKYHISCMASNNYEKHNIEQSTSVLLLRNQGTERVPIHQLTDENDVNNDC